MVRYAGRETKKVLAAYLKHLPKNGFKDVSGLTPTNMGFCG
jgi:hypothetical protein